MKATGIVRRIDDLGRVVIPKEIRRTQMIRVGDPLEIFVSANGEVVFKKYSPVGEMSPLAATCVETVYKVAGVPLNGDLVGSVALVCRGQAPGEEEILLAKLTAALLGRELEG